MNGETILVVDDNKEIVYSISELLKYEGYQVVKAYDGMEALKALETNQIDLILLDVMMPKLNGLSALMKLRENYRIPVIILSAKTEESDKVSGLVLGADDYVEKPYNPSELIARVKAHLRRYHAWGGAAPKTDSDTLVNGGLVLDEKAASDPCGSCPPPPQSLPSLPSYASSMSLHIKRARHTASTPADSFPATTGVIMEGSTPAVNPR